MMSSNGGYMGVPNNGIDIRWEVGMTGEWAPNLTGPDIGSLCLVV